MPEFIIAHGSTEASRAFSDLDAFTQGCIEAAFFTSTGTGDDAENGLEHATFAELAPCALERFKKECEAFQLTQACAAIAWDYDPKQAGHDFWFTAQGHGVGFWDGDYKEAGQDVVDALCTASKASDLQHTYLYRGDDGLIYLG